MDFGWFLDFDRSMFVGAGFSVLEQTAAENPRSVQGYNMVKQ
jgi:hypothetical protein